MMKVLVTGASGFIGKNFCEKLRQDNPSVTIFQVNSQTQWEDIKKMLQESDFLFHFAAVHRPKDEKEFENVNVEYFKNMLVYLKENNIHCDVVMTSSIQAGNNLPYGNSKIEAEELLKTYEKETGCFGHIIRLTNCFGKYAKPNHHSVVATFCYNVSHDIPIRIDDENSMMKLCYIDDVVEKLISYIKMDCSTLEYIDDDNVYTISVGELAKLIEQIKNYEAEKNNDVFIQKLTETYNWYREQD